jgi:THO complex subunit 7
LFIVVVVVPHFSTFAAIIGPSFKMSVQSTSGSSQVSQASVKEEENGALRLEMTDEQIMKRKLMIDGDGMGDDRRINLLMAKFFQWFNLRSERENRNPEEEDILYNRMLHLINDCELTAERSLEVNKTLEQEIESYEDITQEMIQEIDSTKSKIDLVKRDLKDARQVRSNRKEYEPLVEEIEKLPTKQASLEKINQIKKDALLLEAKKKDLLDRISQRKATIQSLVESSELLLSSLNSDEAFGLEDLPDEEYLPVQNTQDSKKSKKNKDDTSCQMSTQS